MAGRMEISNPRFGASPWTGDFHDPDKAIVRAPMKLDAAQFNDAGAVPITLSAAAVIGATSLTVVAVPSSEVSKPYSITNEPAIRAGKVLTFGKWSDVLVTVNDSSITAGDTAITVLALPGPLPSGAYLDFGGGTNAQVVRLSAAAAAGATTITVEPVDGTVANGSTATWTGTSRIAVVSQDVQFGDTTIHVDPLPTPINNASVALYSYLRGKLVKSGTLVGRTYAERDAGTNFGPAVYNDDQVYLVMRDVVDVNLNNDFEGYRNGMTVYEDLLPDWATISVNAQLLATLRAKYECKKMIHV